MNWIVYAIIAMVFFSLSNIIIKIMMSETKFNLLDKEILIRTTIALIISISAIYFLVIRKISLGEETIKTMAIILFLGIIAFTSFIAAIKEGKVAIVSAILGLGTVLTAILSVFFLNEKFVAKEIIAMILAVMSILILVL